MNSRHFDVQGQNVQKQIQPTDNTMTGFRLGSIAEALILATNVCFAEGKSAPKRAPLLARRPPSRYRTPRPTIETATRGAALQRRAN
jgi:hypothetical protein